MPGVSTLPLTHILALDLREPCRGVGIKPGASAPGRRFLHISKPWKGVGMGQGREPRSGWWAPRLAPRAKCLRPFGTWDVLVGLSWG